MKKHEFEKIISNEIEENIKIKGLKKEKKSIAVALSGGCDSLSLTLALNNAGYNVTAILINHHLRDAANQEIKVTTATLKQFNIKYTIQNWNGKYKNNLEAEARKARYKLLLNICKKNNIDVLCIGHHAEDQVETFLLNLARGSGLDGLCCIPKVKILDKIKVIRPMLKLTKQDCKDYLLNLDVKWCEDESNYDIKYKRNKLRFLLNEIEDKNLIIKRILTTIETLQEARETLDILLLNVDKNILQNSSHEITFKREKFLSMTTYLQKSIISKCIMKLANKEYKPRLYQIKNIINSIKTENNFKRTIANLIIYGKNNIIKISINEQNNSSSGTGTLKKQIKTTLKSKTKNK